MKKFSADLLESLLDYRPEMLKSLSVLYLQTGQTK